MKSEKICILDKFKKQKREFDLIRIECLAMLEASQRTEEFVGESERQAFIQVAEQTLAEAKSAIALLDEGISYLTRISQGGKR